MHADVAQRSRISRDLTRSVPGRWLWCLPIAMLVADGAVRQGGAWHLWLAVVAFAIMGAGCLVNVGRCGRTHCYVTGPALLLAALWYALSAAGAVVPHSNYASLAVVIVVALAFIAEFPFGRYIGAHAPLRRD